MAVSVEHLYSDPGSQTLIVNPICASNSSSVNTLILDSRDAYYQPFDSAEFHIKLASVPSLDVKKIYELKVDFVSLFVNKDTLVEVPEKGKSTWIEKLIKHKDSMLSPPPAKVLVLYRKKQPMYEQWESDYNCVQCLEGIQRDALENLKNDTETVENGGYLLILDDLMAESVKDPYILSVYTAGRHQGISGVISVWHNLMPKHGRTFGLNTHIYVLMRSPRIGSQVSTLGSQLGIRKAISDAYKLATENQPYSYLVVDYSDKTTPNAWTYALRSNIWPTDMGPTDVYCQHSGLI